MAKASRSNKKQPEFDPNELSDLIFSPAVGKGVGSHLLGAPAPPFLALAEPLESDTVAETTTVDRSDSKDGSGLQSAASILLDLPVLTDLEKPLASYVSTVDRNEIATVAAGDPGTVNRSELTTVVDSNMATVDKSGLSTVQPSNKVVFWITENGDLVPQGRVKRILSAKDVINPAEQAVYHTLWTAEPLETGERERVVQAGYDYLGKKTRLSKKTIQRIVAKLIDKDFIAVERPADIYRRGSTVYRVFGHSTVLEQHIRKERSHVAKVGPGFSYVRRLEDPRPGHSGQV